MLIFDGRNSPEMPEVGEELVVDIFEHGVLLMTLMGYTRRPSHYEQPPWSVRDELGEDFEPGVTLVKLEPC